MRIEKQATLVATSVAFILVVFKLSVGIMSGSVAILASAIDSLLDMVISLFNYFALHNAEKEPDEAFNFGRRKLEPLAAVIEGTIISLSALLILYIAITHLIHHTPIQALALSIEVMIVSILLTAGLVGFLHFVARHTDNMVIRADALHYKTDLLSNSAVLASLAIIHYTGFNAIDPILGIGIGIYMIYSAYPLIQEGILMLLDAALEPERVESIHALLRAHPKINGYHDLRTRRVGSEIFITVHLVFTTSTSLYDAHKVGDDVEIQLRRLFSENILTIIVHLDPYDDSL